MNHHGSCHCGKISFDVDVEGEIGEVMSCNCSLCSRRGGLLMFVPADKFTLHTPRDAIGTYTFHKHLLQHHFCPTCGIAPFSEGQDGEGNAMAAINVRCVEGVEPDQLTIKHYDGRSR